MELHKLVVRQLHRLGISDLQTSPSSEKWQEFVERVSKAYEGMDQERDLLERSMTISSREMQQLNHTLETAQHIARLGHWHYDLPNEKIFWSKELYNIFDLKYGESPPSYEQFLQMVHEDEREHLRKLVKNAFAKGEEYECEIRVLNADGSYRWYYVIAHPTVEKQCLDGIAMDITKRKQAEHEISLLHKQLISTAHRAGMSEVATSILHNVGNILNSANVSATLIKEQVMQPCYKKLAAIINLLVTHRDSLQDYLFNDSKGKLVVEYIIEVADLIDKNQTSLQEELHNLDEKLEHIKDIVAMQKTLSGVSGVSEAIIFPELIDTALQMSAVENKDIALTKNYEDKFTIHADKSKLLQILVNLIQNAKDALEDKQQDKQITLSLKKANDGDIIFGITDNGIGIPPDNLGKLFSFGFTTKEKGYGFGLHASFLAAKEIGGALSAESSGENLGANFSLKLPLSINEGLDYDNKREQ